MVGFLGVLVSLRPLLLIHRVPTILGASPCGDVMCCRVFPGETVAGHHRTDIVEPAVWSRMMQEILARRPRQSAKWLGTLGSGSPR